MRDLANLLTFLALVVTLLGVWRQSWPGRLRLFVLQSAVLAALAASVGVLADGDAVAQLADGTAMNVFDVAAATWGTPITGTGLSFAGDGLAAGDFGYSSTATAFRRKHRCFARRSSARS